MSGPVCGPTSPTAAIMSPVMATSAWIDLAGRHVDQLTAAQHEVGFADTLGGVDLLS